MNDSRGFQVLQQIAQREMKSLMEYMVGAFPWTTAERSAALERVQSIVQEERDALARLTRYLFRHRIAPPHPGGYPTDFTTLNFVDLAYLTPLLIQEEQKSIAQIASELSSIKDEEGRQIVEEMLAVKKKHLEQLQQLEKPELAVTS
jgi:hypothetical protein